MTAELLVFLARALFKPGLWKHPEGASGYDWRSQKGVGIFGTRSQQESLSSSPFSRSPLPVGNLTTVSNRVAQRPITPASITSRPTARLDTTSITSQPTKRYYLK